MNSRSKRMLELCSITKSSKQEQTRDISCEIKEGICLFEETKRNATVTVLDIDEKENFNILDLPVDIVNESFIETFGIDMIQREIPDLHVTTETTNTSNMQCEVATDQNDEENGESMDVMQTEAPQGQILDQSITVAVRQFQVESSQEDNIQLESVVNDDENIEEGEEKLEAARRKRVIGINFRKTHQDLRMKGKQYVGFRRPTNQTNTFQDVQREPRKQ
ncbi:unnamed protein product, partial [Callosobruchus maculatus]